MSSRSCDRDGSARNPEPDPLHLFPGGVETLRFRSCEQGWIDANPYASPATASEDGNVRAPWPHLFGLTSACFCMVSSTRLLLKEALGRTELPEGVLLVTMVGLVLSIVLGVTSGVLLAKRVSECDDEDGR
jgi:hypothetical protein